MNLYQDKSKDYFSSARIDLVSLLPKNPAQKILEIGAGGGDTLVYIKENGLASEVMGIELFDMPDSHQQNPIIDRFMTGNIEEIEIEAEDGEFDIIICGDVLEHLVDPWATLKKISRYLRKGGLIIASLPNIREINTLMKIFVLGDFRYKIEGGILDKTHLRFFCKKNIIDLFTNDELSPVYIVPSFRYNIQQKSRNLISLMTLRMLDDFLTFQFLIKAEKKA